ncbi:MAG: ABC transporter permease, partial [Hyphomonadaceae bacterium]|nr:ABC transporter permease [Clostridia bacterium]
FFDFVAKNNDVIEYAAPSISGNNITVKSGNKNIKTTSLEGTNYAYETVRNTHVTEGRFLDPTDTDTRQKVVLIGTYIYKELFNGQNAVGNILKINGEMFTVVGVLEEKSTSTASSQDDRVIIPYTSAKRMLKNATIRSYAVQAKSPALMTAAIEKLQAFLLSKLGNADSYNVFNQADLLTRINDTTKSQAILLGGIAAISLLVGGIGIMNIMLVSVTERTREIGIRKAIGAKRMNILTQFIIEAIVVSSLGGIIGVALGLGGSYAMGALMKIPTEPSYIAASISFGFSAFVGVFFGFYPANKASKLNPIEALRFE